MPLDRGIGSGPWGACDGLTTHQLPTTLQDGAYHFRVRTIDIAGNFSAVETYSWQVDTNKPKLEITRAPATNAKRSAAVFEYEYDVGSSAICQLDSEPVEVPCTSDIKPVEPGTQRGKIIYGDLADGPHMFTVTVEDIAANTTTQIYHWNVKTTQPLLHIAPGTEPDKAAIDGDAAFGLVTANGDAECRLDGSTWAPCDSNSSQSYTGLADGFHTFEARGSDASGKESATAEYSWLILSQAPQVTFTDTPAVNTNQTTAPFEFTVDSADPAVLTACSVDGNPAYDCASPTILTALADGSHTIDVTAVDAAGQQTTESYSWNVKAKVPGLGFDSTPAEHSDSADAEFKFSSDEDPDVTYLCSLDNGAWASCSSPVNMTGLADGDHNFRIRATDNVNNSAVEQFDFNVDTVAPTVSFSQKPDSNTTRIAELVRFSANQSDVSYVCELDDEAAGPCSSPLLLSDLTIGEHSLTVHAIDLAGNIGADATVTWTIKEVPAVIIVGNGLLRTKASCPARLGSNCSVVVQAFSGKAGKPVSKRYRVRVRSGQQRLVRLRQLRAKTGRVLIRQRVRSGKRTRAGQHAARSARAKVRIRARG